MKEQTKRMKNINNLIKVIGENDKNSHRPFFHFITERGVTISGYFWSDSKGNLYYLDPYTKVKIDPTKPKHFEHFTGGGTLWEILKDFNQFILHGKKGILRDYKEVWAFEYEETMKVRQFAKEIGFIEHINYPYALQS